MRNHLKPKSLTFCILSITFAFIIAASHMTAAYAAYIPKHSVAESHFYQSASVLVMDADTGFVLYETEGYALRYPASITKIMTALLVLEYIEANSSIPTEALQQRITFSTHAVDIPWYASRMGMQAGDSITILEALYGLMLPSGNEVARALAEFVSGSVSTFVTDMNHRAWELGAFNTRFANPCGLPADNQFTTAYDIARIMREAINHPVFVEVIATPYFDLYPFNSTEAPRTLRNSNRMIRPDDEHFNPYVIGGKTGFTNAAQHTLVSYVANDHHRLIISTLYAPSGATFTDTAALAEYIFARLEAQELLPEIVYELPLNNPDLMDLPPSGNQLDSSQTNNDPSGSSTENYLNIPPNAEYIPTSSAQTTPQNPRRTTSTAEAVATASMSLALIVMSFGGLWWVSKRGTHR